MRSQVLTEEVFQILRNVIVFLQKYFKIFKFLKKFEELSDFSSNVFQIFLKFEEGKKTSSKNTGIIIFSTLRAIFLGGSGS